MVSILNYESQALETVILMSVEFAYSSRRYTIRRVKLTVFKVASPGLKPSDNFIYPDTANYFPYTTINLLYQRCFEIG